MNTPNPNFRRKLNEEAMARKPGPAVWLVVWVLVILVSKRAERVLVFTHKLETALRKEWSTRSIHGADRIEIYRLDPSMISVLAEGLARNVTWYLTVQDGGLSVSKGEVSVEGSVQKLSLAEFLASES